MLFIQRIDNLKGTLTWTVEHEIFCKKLNKMNIGFFITVAFGSQILDSDPPGTKAENSPAR